MRLTSDVPAPISYSFASRRIRDAGISSVYPIPPRIWMLSSAHSVARSAAYKIAPAQSCVLMSPCSSTARAVAYVYARDACS